ncbi:sialate O-acetylesterase [Sinomicrobium sp. M5D2P17]
MELAKMKNFIGLFLVLVATVAQAQLRMPHYFSDHAVLQRDQPVVLWGWSKPSDKLSVTIGDEYYTAKAGADSIWQVQLPAKSAGGPYDISISSAMENVVIKDIYFGDVYFCSGQSNMAFLMKNELHNQEEKEEFPLIRQLFVYRKTAISPQKDVLKAEWMVTETSSFNRLSAVAYYFAKSLHKQEGVPIGIIHASWGASPIETFMDASSLSEFKDASAKVEKITPEFIKNTRKANEQLLKENPDVRNPKGLVNIENRYPTMMYNGMIAPFFAYPVKGVVWYQGENNAFVPLCYDYEAMLSNLITSWRASWNDKKLPFFIVQLANYGKVIDKPKASAWAVVQEAQFNVSQRMKYVRTVVINDIGDPSDIHPRNKRDVGKRLAASALQVIYRHKKETVEGPVLRKADIKDNVFELSFKNVGSGLMAKDDGNELLAFALAGEDNKFYRATAEIRGDKVVVYSKDVPKPVYVRYAFESSPENINFYNKEGFPAVPFRTDRLKDAKTRL